MLRTLCSRQLPLLSCCLLDGEAHVADNTELAYTDPRWLRCELHLAQRMRLGWMLPHCPHCLLRTPLFAAIDMQQPNHQASRLDFSKGTGAVACGNQPLPVFSQRQKNNWCTEYLLCRPSHFYPMTGDIHPHPSLALRLPPNKYHYSRYHIAL